MRKHTSLLICAIIAFLLTGCSNVFSEDVTLPITSQTNNGQITDEPASGLVAEQIPFTAISMPVTTHIQKADDGAEIFQYSCQRDISLVLPNADAAHKIKLDFLNRIDSSESAAKEISNAAVSNYHGGSWTPYLYQVIFEPSRIDYSVVSLSGRTTVYQGFAHPETNYNSVTYDANTGESLLLSDILLSDTDAETIVKLINESLDEQSETLSLYENYKATVSDRFNKNTFQDTRWYFSTTGLCFYFSPYEIAPYASGLVIAEIPYEKLTGILDNAYFPPELNSSNGSIFAEPFNADMQEQFTQFAELILDPNGDMVLLHTDQSVQNIRILTGSWSQNGSIFTPEYTIFAAYSLSPTDAIMVQTELTKNTPSLQITYKANDQQYSHHIAEISNNSVGLQ